MSSEEEEECETQTRHLVKRLPWIRPEAIKVKEDLDEQYITAIATSRQKRLLGKAKGIGSISNRPSPDVQDGPGPCVGYIL